jgi:hypothetical protein
MNGVSLSGWAFCAVLAAQPVPRSRCFVQNKLQRKSHSSISGLLKDFSQDQTAIIVPANAIRPAQKVSIVSTEKAQGVSEV